MSRLAFYIALISLVALAACSRDEITLKSYICSADGKEPENFIRYQFKVQGTKVFQKATDVNSGKDGKSSIIELEDCVVIDIKNWQCGGVPYKGLLEGNGNTERFQVIDGKFSHHAGGLISLKPPMGCDTYLTWKVEGLF